MWRRFKPYVSVGKRRANAAKVISKFEKTGRKVLPVKIDGLKIAHSFWGKGWCDHLESYSDYSDRLQRGRTYVRNGSVCDLQIEPGKVTALVCGSKLYKVNISITAAKADCWHALKRDCAGQIGAVIELLQGRLSESVMRIITRKDSGLFPGPSEIKLNCSCPDSASMCKHVAATLYGVGARLDQQPELLFVLRQVNHLELITDAMNLEAPDGGRSGRKTIAVADLTDVFGIEIGDSSSVAATPPPTVLRRTKRVVAKDHGRSHDKKVTAKPMKKSAPKTSPVVRRPRQPKQAS